MTFDTQGLVAETIKEAPRTFYVTMRGTERRGFGDGTWLVFPDGFEPVDVVLSNWDPDRVGYSRKTRAYHRIPRRLGLVAPPEECPDCGGKGSFVCSACQGRKVVECGDCPRQCPCAYCPGHECEECGGQRVLPCEDCGRTGIQACDHRPGSERVPLVTVGPIRVSVYLWNAVLGRADDETIEVSPGLDLTESVVVRGSGWEAFLMPFTARETNPAALIAIPEATP